MIQTISSQLNLTLGATRCTHIGDGERILMKNVAEDKDGSEKD